jgi:hypothetical protein
MRSFSQSYGKKIGLGLMACLVVAWLVAWELIPSIAKEMLEEQGSAFIGRKVSIRTLEWNPWSMEVEVLDLTVAGVASSSSSSSSSSSQPSLHIQRIYVNAEWESLLRMEPVLENIAIDTPRLRIAHLGKGVYDFDDILKNIEKWQKNHPSPPDAATTPIPFALYNIQINHGSVDFWDEKKPHRLANLQLGVPFVSNIATHRAVTVQPRLAFDLNGSHFETVATTTPSLTHTEKTSAHFKIFGFDLAQYASYLPANFPIKPQSAVLNADLRLQFDATEPNILDSKIPTFALSGTVYAANVSLIDRQNQPALTMSQIALDIKEARPLERILQLQSLSIQSPVLHAMRSKQGNINWIFAPPPNGKPEKSGKPEKPWAIQLHRFDLQQGALHWSDAKVNPAAELHIEQWDVKAQSFHWPLTTTPVSVTSTWQMPSPAPNGKSAQIHLKAQMGVDKVNAQATVRDANLLLAAPYLAPMLEPTLTLYGVVDTDMKAEWSGTGIPIFSFTRAAVRNFALKSSRILPKEAKNSEIAAHDLPSWEILDITNATLDTNTHSAAADKMILRSPSVMLHRNTNKEWVALRWFKLPATAANMPEPPTGGVEAAVAAVTSVIPIPSLSNSSPHSSSNAGATAWKANINEVRIEQGHVRFDDRAPAPRGVRLELSDLSLKLNNANLLGNEPIPLKLSAYVKSARSGDKIEPGYVGYQGDIQWNPVTAKGKLTTRALPLHVFMPYLAKYINFSAERADASYQGDIQLSLRDPNGLQLETKGDAALDDWNIQTPSSKGGFEELLTWRTLQLPGMSLHIAPNQPTKFQLARATLSDFYARIMVDKEGRINLQNLQKKSAIPAVDEKPSTTEISIGPIQMNNGKMLFSDYYITPNYTVNLSSLNGNISQFSSISKIGGVIELADMNLSGLAESTARLEIKGRINPLTKPLVMSIQGKVRDLDLPALTPYAQKYSGYSIERGKLNMDVHYEIQPNGEIVASNQLLLKQLAFSEKKEGKQEGDTTDSLPLKLAMALLSDRNGMINLDLPITGSLNDPDFELGAVLWKIFTNLIAKALSSPFSLLAKAFGSDDDGKTVWNFVEFAIGSSTLTSTAMQELNNRIALLKERPELDITITGEAHLDIEKEGFKREQLRQMALFEKRRQMLTSTEGSLGAISLTQDEYPELLRMVYRRSDVPKPVNWIGMIKEIPIQEMETALLANIVVTEDSIRELALQRSSAVRDYLMQHKLDPSRIFLQAPHTQHTENQWKPRVQLGVQARSN